MQDFVQHGKQVIRSGLNRLHLDLTQNLRYDRLTRKVIRRVIREGDTCIDIGSHYGEILDLMLRYSPTGLHLGFEPLPHMFRTLAQKYAGRCRIYPYALSNQTGVVSFQWAHNAPAYSGLQKRTYNTTDPGLEEIEVETRRLDDLISELEGPTPACVPIRLMKIDVEGAEYSVLQGALQLLKRDKPVVIFEFGLGASDHYGVNADMMYRLLTEEAGLQISLLEDYLLSRDPLSREAFCDCYVTGREYYFIAHPSLS